MLGVNSMRNYTVLNGEIDASAGPREDEEARRLRWLCAEFRNIREEVFKSVASYSSTTFPWSARDDVVDISSADGFPSANLILLPVVAEDFRNACLFICGKRAVLRVNRSVYVKFNDLKKGIRLLLGRAGKITLFLDGTKNTIRVPAVRVAVLPRAIFDSNSEEPEFVEVPAVAM